MYTRLFCNWFLLRIPLLPGSPLFPYTTLFRSLVANWHRDRSRRQEIPLNDLPVLPSKGDHPERNLVRSQEQESLLRLIRRLPSERQNLLILKFVENMSNAEIGQIMGRSEGAVKSLYHRTLLALRDQLGGQSINLDSE